MRYYTSITSFSFDSAEFTETRIGAVGFTLGFEGVIVTKHTGRFACPAYFVHYEDTNEQSCNAENEAFDSFGEAYRFVTAHLRCVVRDLVYEAECAAGWDPTP